MITNYDVSYMIESGDYIVIGKHIDDVPDFLMYLRANNFPLMSVKPFG